MGSFVKILGRRFGRWTMVVVGIAWMAGGVDAGIGRSDAGLYWARFQPVPGLEQPTETSPAPPPPAEAPPPTRGGEALPGQDQFYDRTNPSYPLIQKANESLAKFPLDRKGYVDWMEALRSGRIQPRADLRGEKTMEVLDLDVVMKDTKEMPYVVFPHRSHTLWLACSNCHSGIFEAKAGANDITMADIFKGRYCGVCHDRVAFITFFSCDRCHRIAHGPAAE